MPVTHSPGNPFAFSPAIPRKPSFTESATFQHYRSPGHAPSSAPRPSLEDSQREIYDMKSYKENVTHDLLLKDARIEELERKIMDEGKKMERTESDKRFLFELQEKQASEITNLKDELALAKKNADASVRDLRTSYNKLKNSHLSMEDQERATSQAHQREMDHMRSDTENQRRAMEALKSDLTSKNDMLTEKAQRIEALERKLDEQAVSAVSGSAEDLSFVTKELALALSRVNALETTNTSQMAKINRLQEANGSIAVLKEEKVTLETKVQVLESARQELAEAQVQVAQLEREKATWLGLLGEDEVSDLATILEKQKNQLEAATIQTNLLEEQLNDSNSIITALRQEVTLKSDNMAQMDAKMETEKRNLARVERSRAMNLREVNFLREQLKSYDLEERVESVSFDELKTARIAELEVLLDAARQEIAAEEPNASIGMKRPREEVVNDFNEIERGEYLRKIRALNADLEITRKEEALVRKELASLKATNPPRILQHKRNPASTHQAIRTQTLLDLQVENKALLDQLARNGTPTVPIQSLRNAETELSKSGELVRQKEKMIQRLKEVFSAKSSEFREAVYSLLGYKLDFLQNGRVRLTSMYAETMDHAFLFDGEAGTMQLSGERHGNEAFMDSVGNLIRYWSGEKNSIPGMLSALTLELLDKQGCQE